MPMTLRSALTLSEMVPAKKGDCIFVFGVNHNLQQGGGGNAKVVYKPHGWMTMTVTVELPREWSKWYAFSIWKNAICHQYINWPLCLCESLLLSWLCLVMNSPHGPDLFMWSFTTFADYFDFHLRKRNVEARCPFSIGVLSLFSLYLSVVELSHLD